MTRRVARGGLAGLGLAALALSAAPATAASSSTTATDGRVAVIVIANGITFEDAMGAPGLQAVARAGGAGVMSVRTVPGDAGPGHELTLGTGVRSSVPFPTVHVATVGNQSVVLGFDRIVAANRHRSEPGLLGSVLEANGLSACSFGDVAALVAMDRQGTTGTSEGCDVEVYDFSLSPKVSADPAARADAAGRLSAELALLVPNRPRALLMVLGAQPSASMDAVRDELTPFVMAEGAPASLFSATGDEHTVTSDTTHRDGLVSNEDVAPTILRFFGIAAPSEMNGQPIDIVRDTGPPFTLHRKHLENRHIGTPVALMALVWVVLAGVIPMLLIRFRRRVPGWVGRAGTVLPLTGASIGIALLAAGRLPTLSYTNAVPLVLAITVLVAALALELRRFGALAPAAGIGAAVLVYYLFDAIQGWPDTPFTLLGGTALDGARFYGLPNNATGLLLGASLWLASVLAPWAGYGLLVAVGLFAGFPMLGADLGGALTMFVAAGLWWGLRTRGRLKWVDLLITGGTVVAGMAVVLLAQVTIASKPTHGTKFVHEAGGGLSGLVRLATERLGTGIRLIVDSPLSWLVIAGLPVALYFALRPPGVIREELERWPQWRAAVLTTLAAGIVAYVVNDTGVAAAGFAFGLGAAGLLWLPMVEGPWWEPAGGTDPARGRARGRPVADG
ncbi:MAG TPA: hypothetical protein VNN79_00665 [Actinomycetota bacterium]|nr:hypothetical protein [Actinomycetota bacterium]